MPISMADHKRRSMGSLGWALITVAAVGVSALVVASWDQPPSPSADTTSSDRATKLALARPDLSERELSDLMARSDAANRALEEAGITEEEVAVRVAAYRKGLTVTEEELQAFHQARTDLFGNRPFHECRSAADRLIRIERTLQAIQAGAL